MKHALGAAILLYSVGLVVYIRPWSARDEINAAITVMGIALLFAAFGATFLV